MANDFTWLTNDTTDKENIAVCFIKNGANKREENFDNSNYILNIYS